MQLQDSTFLMPGSAKTQELLGAPPPGPRRGPQAAPWPPGLITKIISQKYCGVKMPKPKNKMLGTKVPPMQLSIKRWVSCIVDALVC